MTAHALTIVLALAAITGCAADAPSSELSTNHPAHSDAKEAPVTDPHAGHQAVGAEPNSKLVPYPLDICLVGDEGLNSMGKPYVFAYANREIKLCCKACEKSFKEDPAKYLKKLEEASKVKKPAAVPAHDHSDHP
jgi:hypothetical protein